MDEPPSTASTGEDVGAVKSMEEGVLSSSESETTKQDDWVFSKREPNIKDSLTESQTNVQKKQLHSGDDMQN